MTSWPRQTLAETLAATAAAHAQQEALVIAGRRLTYAELRDNVREVAQSLRAAGIGRGDHVAVCMGNALEWVIFFYAAASVGAVTVPLNTRLKADELQYCLRQADVRLLFIADRFLTIDFIAMLRTVCPALDRTLPDAALPLLRTVVVLGDDVPAGAMGFSGFLAAGATYEEAWPQPVTPDDVLLLQYTSGTTAHPRGVLLTHDSMLRNAFHVTRRFHLRSGDRYYSARPFYHVAGTTLSLLATLVSGACLLSAPAFDAGTALAVMAREKCTHTSGNDTLFLMLMQHQDFGKTPLHLHGGWAAAGPEVSRRIVERMGIRNLCHAYGLSEAAPNVCMSRHDDDPEKRIGGWAHVLDGLEVRIVDADTGAVQPPGHSGEIRVRGWSVMKGYYNMPAETAAAITPDGWLRTGDLGVMDEEGRLRFLARIKDVFRVGGENVAPAEVEEILQRHPAILQAQVVGVPDPRLTEVPAAYVILAAGATATPEAIIAWCSEHMANFRVPRYVKIIDSFDPTIMTGSAKIRKSGLRAQALRDFGLGNRKTGA